MKYFKRKGSIQKDTRNTLHTHHQASSDLIISPYFFRAFLKVSIKDAVGALSSPPPARPHGDDHRGDSV